MIIVVAIIVVIAVGIALTGVWWTLNDAGKIKIVLRW